MAKKQLQDLVTFLSSNPSIKLHIVGHATIKKSHKFIDGNSEEALNQEGFGLNGKRTDARGLMNAKADAVRMFLISEGINEDRITIGPGAIFRLNTDKDLGIGGKVGLTIKN